MVHDLSRWLKGERVSKKILFHSGDMFAFSVHPNGLNLPDFNEPWIASDDSQHFMFIYDWEPLDFAEMQRQMKSDGFCIFRKSPSDVRTVPNGAARSYRHLSNRVGRHQS